MTITAPQSQIKTSVRPAEPCAIVIFGAAGDMPNDVPMFERSGLSIAMGVSQNKTK